MSARRKAARDAIYGSGIYGEGWNQGMLTEEQCDELAGRALDAADAVSAPTPLPEDDPTYADYVARKMAGELDAAAPEPLTPYENFAAFREALEQHAGRPLIPPRDAHCVVSADYRYLCTNGHHVVSANPDIIECDCPVHDDGVKPYVTTGSIEGVRRCGARLQRYYEPDEYESESRAAALEEALRALVAATTGDPTVHVQRERARAVALLAESTPQPEG